MVIGRRNMSAVFVIARDSTAFEGVLSEYGGALNDF